jgi:hypothetical protein
MIMVGCFAVPGKSHFITFMAYKNVIAGDAPTSLAEDRKKGKLCAT